MPQIDTEHCLLKRLSRLLPTIALFLILQCLLLPAFAVADMLDRDQAVGKRPVTVADSIDMTRLVDPDNPLLHSNVTNFNFSPNGRHFFIVTRRGDLRSGVNIFELKLYDVGEVLEFVNSESVGDAVQERLPRANILVRLETTSNHGMQRLHAIREAKWLNDEIIGFIGDSGDKPGQVFSVDIKCGKQKQLTHHDRNIFSFDSDKNNAGLLYLSTLPNYDEDRNKTYIVAGIRSALKLSSIDKEDPSNFKYRLYYQPLGNETAAQPVSSVFLGGVYYTRHFWLSPNGKKAIAAMPYGEALDGEAPDSVYQHYKPIANNHFVMRSLKDFDSNISVSNKYSLFRLILIDMHTGATEEILEDAPTGFGSGGFRLKATWLPDSNNVILATTFLPRGDSDADEWERRRRSPAIVNYNVLTKHVTRITDVPVQEGETRASEPFYDMSLDLDGLLSVQFRKLIGGATISLAFKLEEGEWVRAQTPEKQPRRLALSHRQGMNTSPEILATDSKTGKQRVVTDMNPGFRQLRFGRVELFDWVDAAGRDWQGALVYPPAFDVGRRYPLVVQTHGFRGEDIFYIDGSFPVGPYAAQALANRDMLVLQLPDKQEGRGQREELHVHQQGVESAIDALEGQGLIDKERVGIMGFSRSGFYVDHLIAFSDYDFAAALITDGSNLNFSYYPQLYGLGAPGMMHMEDMLGGAVPWGDSLQAFVSRMTTFNLDRVKTPLRLERYLDNHNYAGSYWDQHALMRRLHKPVELILYPKANHATINPTARMASAGGSVDWFAFWLKGEEDSNPAKVQQYERWRELRKQQNTSGPAAITARMRARQKIH